MKLKRRFKVFVCLNYVLSVVTSGAETNQVNVGWAFTALTVIHCFGGRRRRERGRERETERRRD